MKKAGSEKRKKVTRAKSLGFIRLPSFKSSDSDSSEDYDLHYAEYEKGNYEEGDD